MATETAFEWMERTGFVDLVLMVLAVAGPIFTALLAYWFRTSPVVENYKADWLLAVLAGPIVFLLWRAFNGIMNRFGLESLTATGLALLLFLAVAAGLAGLMRILDQQWGRSPNPGTGSPSNPGGETGSGDPS